MANTIWKASTVNAFNTTLNGSITDADVTIVLSSVTGLQAPGVLVIDRTDGAGGITTSNREYISFTSINGSSIEGVARGLGGSSAQAHNSGAQVEEVISITHWNDLRDWALVDHNTDGTHSDIIADSMTTDSVVAETTNGDLDLAGNGTGTVIKPSSLILYVVEGTTNITTGDGKFYLTIPKELNGTALFSVHARVITAGTTGTTDIQIHNVTDTTDILSTKLTIDSGETGSDTAATPAVINTSNDDVVTNDLLRIDVDAVSTTPPQGLIVRLEFRKP